MSIAKFKHNDCEFQFSEEDIVNPDDFIPDGEYNPHNVRPWFLHDHGFCVAVVFADCLQDAIDEAVDEDKMDRYLISESDLKEDYDDEESESISYLGNAGEPFDIESLGFIELSNPKFSLISVFQLHFDKA